MRIAPSVLGMLLSAMLAMGATSSTPSKQPTSSKQPAPAKAAEPAAAAGQPADTAAKEPPLVPLDDPFIKTFEFAPMGTVYVYLPKKIDDDTDIVLFASGDGGWEPRVVDMVVKMQARGQIVVGFSTPEYLKRLDASKLKCAYPPGELEGLSQFIQRKLNVHVYRTPIVVGYSSGASLAYVAMAQTPINAFVGAVGLGFCPELALTKPLCRQGALTKVAVFDKDHWRLYPVEKLVSPLEVLQGQADELCKVDDVAAFMKQVDNTKVTSLPKIGHGFSSVNEWFPAFVTAYKAIDEKRPTEAPPSSEALAGLPLIERPVESKGDTFVVMLSGDGGWSTLTEKVTTELNDSGFPVVGWNMLKYFWSAKTPEHAAGDLATIIRYFAQAWHKDQVVLAGYSMGADVLPAIVNRLPIAEQQRVRSIVLMAPERATDFEFHLGGWLQHIPKDALPIAPEVAALPEGVRMTCIYGSDEAERSLCTQLDANKPTLTLKALPGAHHFDGDYEALANLVR